MEWLVGIAFALLGVLVVARVFAVYFFNRRGRGAADKSLRGQTEEPDAENETPIDPEPDADDEKTDDLPDYADDTEELPPDE